MEDMLQQVETDNAAWLMCVTVNIIRNRPTIILLLQ